MNKLRIAVLSAALAGCGPKEKSEETEAKPPPVVEVTLGKSITSNIAVAIHSPATVFPHEQANIAAKITAPIRQYW